MRVVLKAIECLVLCARSATYVCELCVLYMIGMVSHTVCICKDLEHVHSCVRRCVVCVVCSVLV